jgi:HlyD family secretion protein
MSRRPTLFLLALGVLLTAGTMAWLLRAPRVPAVELKPAPLVRTLQFSARVATLSRVDVGSTLTGRVVDVLVAEGARVRRGEGLVNLESDELQAALAQARASERQAAARLAGLRSSGRSSALAALAQADSVLTAAQADLQRNQELVARGFVSAARLDDAVRAVAVATAQQASARAQIAANADQGTDVTQAQAALALATSARQAAASRLAQAQITAPADAVVLQRQVEPGQIVQPGKALLTLALAGPVQLLAQVDEMSLEQLQVGQVASVLADAFPRERFGARVLSIAPQVDAQRGAVEVRLALVPPAPDFLREDMTLSVEVETARRGRTLVLPLEALRSDDGTGGATAWVDDGGRVALRTLRLGVRTLDAVEVLDGLGAGDKVLLGEAPEPGARVRADLGPGTGSLPAVPAGTAAKPGAKGRADDAGSALGNAMGR